MVKLLELAVIDVPVGVKNTLREALERKRSP